MHGNASIISAPSVFGQTAFIITNCVILGETRRFVAFFSFIIMGSEPIIIKEKGHQRTKKKVRQAFKAAANLVIIKKMF